MTIKRRAISDNQKEERRQIILNKAWELLQDRRYETINIVDVAHSLELAKGTLYLYFPTKEALFLAVLEQQFEQWFNEIDAKLQNHQPKLTVELLARMITASLEAKPRLSRLFAIAHVILEQNIDFAIAKSYKEMLHGRVRRTGELLEQHLSFLHAGQGAQFLLRAYSVVIGVENLARPAEVVQTVLESDSDLALFLVDFSTELFEMLVAILRSYQGV
jgi:AcrR family transcriptional regulator